MYYRQGLLDKLEKKCGWLAIRNLMLILVGAMAIVFIMDRMLMPMTGVSLAYTLNFDRAAILSGQVWRIFTFLFLPPEYNLLFLVILLYLYYLIGTTLENQWGAFGFTVYYLLGVVGAIISGFITGYATNEYLNLSLMFAFAMLNPNFELLLFFFIPVKMKWLALIDAVGFVLLFVLESWAGRLSLIFAVINVFIFFTPHFIDWVKSLWRRWKWRQNFKK
ncbi:MAG: hypothetical protein E7632_04915 [Ruminococcaceae bacterium]|nr:hypothetical protein [Oscillospiraceae bacterium]